MNPADIEHQPSFELPKPHGAGESAASSAEQAPAAELSKQAPSGPPPNVPITPVLTAYPPVAPAPTGAQATPAPGHTNPLIADDADIIEKVWVEKAKAIVAQTKDDPHQQNKQISKFKADYVKKRYNKEIKVSEE